MDKRFVVALVALIASFAAAAGLIHVKPTTLVMSPGQSAAVLTVTNNGDKPIMPKSASLDGTRWGARTTCSRPARWSPARRW